MEIRQLNNAEEFEQAIQLADSIFRDNEHISMGDAFPHVFSKSLKQSFAAFDGNRLVSFMGLVPSKVRINESVINVFSIGAVCTDPEYRKQGISTKILNKVYQYIDEAEGSILLISGDRGLYMRNHCYHFGEINRYRLGNLVEGINYNGVIRLGQASDLLKIDQLKQTTSITFDSSIWEWATLVDAGGYASIFKMEQKVYVAEHEDELEGYVVISLPQDKSSKKEAIVTDWGGKPSTVKDICINLINQGVATELDIDVPWQDQLNNHLAKYYQEKTNNGGTIHIVNPIRLVEQLMPYLKEKDAELAEQLSVRIINEDKIELSINNNISELNQEQFVQMIFNFTNNNAKIESLFPIPFPSTLGLYYV